MDQNIKKKQIIAITVNLIIVLSVVIIATAGIVFGAGSGQVGNNMKGLGYFKPFTMDSNILAGISSLVFVIYSIRNLRNKAKQIPSWVSVLQLMGTSCLFLTFLVAALFLAPMNVMKGKSYFIMFSDDMFFFHLLNPVLAIISFTRLNNTHIFKKRECFLGMMPTIIYSIVYLVMVVIVKKWNDFYGFTFGGKYYLVPLVIIVLYGLVLVLSILLTRGHNRNIQKENKV